MSWFNLKGTERGAWKEEYSTQYGTEKQEQNQQYETRKEETESRPFEGGGDQQGQERNEEGKGDGVAEAIVETIVEIAKTTKDLVIGEDENQMEAENLGHQEESKQWGTTQ